MKLAKAASYYRTDSISCIMWSNYWMQQAAAFSAQQVVTHTPICPCGDGEETINDFLFQCKEHNNITSQVPLRMDSWGATAKFCQLVASYSPIAIALIMVTVLLTYWDCRRYGQRQPWPSYLANSGRGREELKIWKSTTKRERRELILCVIYVYFVFCL